MFPAEDFPSWGLRNQDILSCKCHNSYWAGLCRDRGLQRIVLRTDEIIYHSRDTRTGCLVYIMASVAATLGVIILSGFFSLLTAKNCDLYAAVGQSLTLPFAYDGLNISHTLRWTHNSRVVFYRQQGRVLTGKSADISATGSLLLNNLQFSSAGEYQATVLHSNGTLANSWNRNLCMMDKVLKPQLTYNCDFKSASVILNCYTANPQGLVFLWELNEKSLPGPPRQELRIPLTQLKGGSKFTCSVANKIAKEKSEAVHPTCVSPSPSPPKMICFTSKTVLAVATGGAVLILLLLTIIIILCCCHKSKKTQMRIKDRGELRMLSVSKREPDSIPPDYETMNPVQDSPPLNSEPSPRACYETVSQPVAKTENRPSHLSTATEGQQPSPVPKPRTKMPQTPKV